MDDFLSDFDAMDYDCMEEYCDDLMEWETEQAFLDLCAEAEGY